MKEIENPMIIDSLWRDREKEPEVVGECAGCEEGIRANEDWYGFMLPDGERMIHQNAECCQQFIADISICKIAGEH